MNMKTSSDCILPSSPIAILFLAKENLEGRFLSGHVSSCQLPLLPPSLVL